MPQQHKNQKGLLGLFKFLENVYFQLSGFFFGVVYLSEDHLYILDLIHPVVIHGVAVGDKLASRVPVANRQRGDTEKTGDFFYC